MSSVQDIVRWIKERNSIRRHKKDQGAKAKDAPKSSGHKQTDDITPAAMKMSRRCASSANEHGRHTENNADIASQGQETTGVDRRNLELPPIPNLPPYFPNLPDVSRDCAQSPGHYYDEIPAYAIDTRREILHHIRTTELKKMNARNLDFDRARDYGAYLVVPIRDRYSYAPESESMSGYRNSQYLQDPQSADQLDQLISYHGSLDELSLYREGTDFSGDKVRSNNHGLHSSMLTKQGYLPERDRVDSRSDDSGVSSPFSHNATDAHVIRDATCNTRQASPQSWDSRRHHYSDSDSSLYPSAAAQQTGSNAASDSDLLKRLHGHDPSPANAVRDRRPIQRNVYSAIKEEATVRNHLPENGWSDLDRFDPVLSSSVHRAVEGQTRTAPHELNHSSSSSNDTYNEYDINTDDSSLSPQEYDYYLDKAKENLLLKHLVRTGEADQQDSDLDEDTPNGGHDVSFDLTSVTSLSDLSMLAEEEIVQITGGASGNNAMDHQVHRSSSTKDSIKDESRSNSQSSSTRSAFVPYASTRKDSITSTNSGVFRPSPSELSKAMEANKLSDSARLSCRVTTSNPLLASRRLSGSHIRRPLGTQGPTAAHNQNQMLSEIMKKNYDRQLLVLF